MLYPTELRADMKKAHEVSFFQLIFWSEYKDSNLGPPGPKPGALPDCATLRQDDYYKAKNLFFFQASNFFERPYKTPKIKKRWPLGRPYASALNPLWVDSKPNYSISFSDKTCL